MGDFMECGERPGRGSVIVVNHRERRDVIGDSEAAKSIYRNFRVMATEIAQKEDENPGLLYFGTEIRKCTVDRLLGTELIQAELDLSAYALC